MQISIQNIGKIKKVNLLLDGFTVIAGENDSGKSTVGKTVFAITQAFSMYPQFKRERIRRRTLHFLRFFGFELRRNFNLTGDGFLKKLSSINIGLLDPEEGLREIKFMLDKLEKLHPEKSDLLQHLSYKLNDARNELSKMVESNDIFDSISDLMGSEFGGEINRKQDSLPPSFAITDGETTVISAKFDGGAVSDGVYSGDLGLFDATYIDGASMLQFSHLINLNEPDARLPFHITDLARKLTNSALAGGLDSNLADIYKGRLIFDDSANNFYLDKGGYRVCLNNIASGIKNIGLIDLLVKKGFICEGSLLILDEPEVNLHPKWQIQLAEVICELRRGGVYILLTTHSPYMIQALQHYSNLKEVKANFYLAHRNIDNSDDIDFIDLSMNVGSIIESLAAPLWSILEENSDF